MTPADSAPPRFARRQVLLAGAALATLIASIWALDDTPDSAAPAVHRTPAAPATASARAAPDADLVLALALPERGSFNALRRDLFAGTGTAPAASAPPVAVAASAPAPAASVPLAVAAPPPPPLAVPFTYGGRLVTEAGPSVLLNEGPLTRVLAVGASLGDFRLEQDAGTQLVFTHVPSGERVVLALQP